MYECGDQGGDGKNRETFPHIATWWTQLTAKLFTLETFVVYKATKMFNLLRPNLSDCSKQTKATASWSLVRPLTEYASYVWDPNFVISKNRVVFLVIELL